jgi:hypothetical protein
MFVTTWMKRNRYLGVAFNFAGGFGVGFQTFDGAMEFAKKVAEDPTDRVSVVDVENGKWTHLFDAEAFNATYAPADFL